MSKVTASFGQPDQIFMSYGSLQKLKNLGYGPSASAALKMVRALYNMKLIPERIVNEMPLPEEWKNEKRV